MSQWNTYLTVLQRDVDEAIVAHYDATLKVQAAREKLRAACFDAAEHRAVMKKGWKARHEAAHEAARNKHEAMKVATSNVINEFKE